MDLTRMMLQICARPMKFPNGQKRDFQSSLVISTLESFPWRLFCLILFQLM